MKLREDWKTRCKELKILKQSIHDHNPISIPASYKPMVESNHLINYKKPIYISVFTHRRNLKYGIQNKDLDWNTHVQKGEK